MSVVFRLDQHQTRAFQIVQPGRTCTFPFGRGSGKTFLARALLHSLALSKPNQQIGVLYPSLKQAKKVLWMGPTGLFTDCALLMRAGQVRRYHRAELTIEYANGSQVTTWGAENAGGILGQRFSALIEDETDDIDPEVERAVVQPTFSKAGREAIWVKFGTPRRGRHGSLFASYAAAEQEAKGYRTTDAGTVIHAPELPRSHFGFKVRSADSPQVDQAWLGKVRGELYSKGKGPTYEREYECNFDSSEGLVYPIFNADFHVREPDYGVPWTEILVGVDHGWNDPGVYLPHGILGNGRDSIAHILEEVYETAKDTTWWADKAAETAWKYRHYRQRWYADPSRPDRIVDIRRAVLEAHPELRGSFTIEPGENAIEAGVDAVADRLAIREDADGVKTSRLFVSPQCANTISEFGKYRRKRDPRNQEVILDEIVDKDNHCLAGNSLITTSRGLVPICDVTSDDYVPTRAGMRRVAWAGLSGWDAPMWRLETSAGRVLEGTAEHRVWTQNHGWVHLDSLRYGDMLVAWENTVEVSAFDSMVSCFGDTQPPLIGNCACTSHRRMDGGCTERSGSTSTGLFLTASTSTTRTWTRSTTQLITSNAYRPQRMPQSIPGGQSRMPVEPTLPESGHWPSPGTEVKRALSGIASMGVTSSRTDNASARYASSAAGLSTATHTSANSAATRASPIIGAPLASMMSTECARRAAQRSEQVSIPGHGHAVDYVRRVFALGRRAPVYDLTVDGEPEFFANGVLVHNSMDATRYPIFTRFGGPDRRRHESGPSAQTYPEPA